MADDWSFLDGDKKSGMGLNDLVTGKAPKAAPAAAPARPQGMWSRFTEALGDAASRSPVGMGVRYLYRHDLLPDALGVQKPQGWDKLPQEQRDAIVAKAERDRRAQYDAGVESDGGGVSGKLARGAGMLVGSADPTNLIAPGASVATRMLAQGAISGITDAATQGGEVHEGIRDNFDPMEVAASAGTGAAFQGGIEGAGHVIKTAAKDLVHGVKSLMPVNGKITSPFGDS
jgi:hypothetical protein